MYHYIAHDPVFIRGFDAYVDAPRMRYRRILVPLAAQWLAFGNDDRVDGTYVAVILMAVFGGGYWLAMYCALLGYSAAWGLTFVLIPATLISMDRMTVDAALAVLCVAFAVFVMRGSRWGLYVVLVAAALVRETGFVLIAAYVIWLASQRKFRQAALFLTTAIPALAWYLFVLFNTDPEGFEGLSLIPFQGVAQRILSPYKYQSQPG